MFGWVTHLIAFLGGAAAGAIGRYFADKYTDRRRSVEAERDSLRQFSRTRALMPELLEEMRKDHGGAENRHVRLFVVLRHKSIAYRYPQKHFVYFEDEHDDLIEKAQMLEKDGYVTDESTGSLPVYRMTEEFVSLLETMRPK